MDIEAWAAAVSHYISIPTGLRMQTSHYALCSHRTLLPIPYHINKLRTRDSTGAIATTHTDLSKSVQPSSRRPAMPWFCMSPGSTAQPTQGKPQLPLHSHGGVPPRWWRWVRLQIQQCLQTGTGQHLAAAKGENLEELNGLAISQRKSCSAVEWLAGSWSRGHSWAASGKEGKATEIWACQDRKNHIHSLGIEQKVRSRTYI